jgi:RluA family pseudouridine synthase
VETLFEDNDVVAINKPAGVAVIPGRDETPEQSLRGMLEAARREKLWVVHRLDRDTSGVVLFARNEKAHRSLSMAFEGRSVEKTYLAWTRGVPNQLSGVISTPLHSARKGKMRPALPNEEGSLSSETGYSVRYAVETAAGPVALVEAAPKTGRQHQIRVHLRSVEAPLLVDEFYGKCESVAAGGLGAGSPEVPRLTLHAAKIMFPHPSKGPVTVEAPLPVDLRALDVWLKARAG